jgi:hypothetical protein
VVRTQIYLTKGEYDRIRRAAARTGMTQSEIIRAAVDQWLERSGRINREQLLDSVAGIWRQRNDLPDFAALRREADRIGPTRRS